MSITTALEARRDALRDREAGFTLIELLVVVIIIGILAAIAIPVYIGVQNNAKESAVKSDLSNDKTAVVAYWTNNPSAAAPALTTAALGTYGFTMNPADYAAVPAFSGAASSTSFCITATAKATNNQFYVTNLKGVTQVTPTVAVCS
ncbi:MAG: type pilus assembly protein PilA [Microbacteriaceae bacterium]|jgi:prepilin-type N-terminal cleavage/methylation domain-containing protein|nr:type pilus assembly protein PilA [Microbacteriaceae bacterium]